MLIARSMTQVLTTHNCVVASEGCLTSLCIELSHAPRDMLTFAKEVASAIVVAFEPLQVSRSWLGKARSKAFEQACIAEVEQTRRVQSCRGSSRHEPQGCRCATRAEKRYSHEADSQHNKQDDTEGEEDGAMTDSESTHLNSSSTKSGAVSLAIPTTKGSQWFALLGDGNRYGIQPTLVYVGLWEWISGCLS